MSKELKNRSEIRKMILASFFIALGIVLPFVTGNIAILGSRFLPMHIPVLFAGIILGWKYGLLVGLITPLLRAVTIGMPPLFPVATVMAFELATYGFLIGLFYRILPKKYVFVFVSLILAMIGGRIVWGIAASLIYPLAGFNFNFQIFLAGALINAVPGIILQLILIPALFIGLKRADIITE
ncbi:MAG: ECF transporter S component [Acholeplasmataceae bacterium]|nr:ECF transporter S component [Acholeplasmataceae bacterium]